jgi:hypothetical protein
LQSRPYLDVAVDGAQKADDDPPGQNIQQQQIGQTIAEKSVSNSRTEAEESVTRGQV